MLRRSLHRQTILGAVATCTLCSAVYAQQTCDATVSKDTKLDRAALEARAAEIRQKVVHQFGTSAEIAAFDHPHQKAVKMKRPKLSKDGTMNAETLAAMTSSIAYHLEPAQIYDTIFFRFIFREVYEDTSSHRATAGDSIVTAAKATAKLESLIPTQVGSTLANQTLAKGMEKANAANENQQLERFAQARIIEITKIITALMPAELERYNQGSYRTRAAILFKAGELALDRQQIPNAYILMLCDPGGRNAAGGEEELSWFNPEIASHYATTPEHWQAVANLQSKFMHDGAEAFSGPEWNEQFLARMPSAGKEARSVILSSLGAAGETQYKSAPKAEQEHMERTAAAMFIAADILFGTIAAERQTAP